ncbi:Stk1 family PASTA domain-containing Ser/Thr kinase [Lacticaseibacillus brantae]|uniref:non-specific serine/threonine protein kinase n=1 Tax=Lacticaseibacillus brantae DSM 23927 TaxID=1423727 RepID=A0A0R2B164_9LACO|nr:Stk1 family PASTA domain-containing Ser/Thr kinase [Lacticaseibacillus brantae]KRM72805.1 hypothetical protein FC34_GL000516 [Lacticaseibacillus brantae DSM 23927]
MIEPGITLNGRYRLIKTLGEGGMANVYLAHDLILDRDVAVKVLRLDLQNDPDTVRRFQREAMATIQLNHPNIVSIYDVGESHGQQYLVMEYVEGTDLKKYIVEHFPIPYQQVVDMMTQILSAVQLAHDHHLIHRDLKPQNVLVDANGNAMITDFGIAIALADNAMTQTNSMLGSVHYLSPEQARGSMPTRQSDIYALGIILYEMLTGSVPFEGDSAVSIALKHFQTPMPSVRAFDPRIPQALENVVLKATAKNPADRYSSADAMASDLSTALSARRASEPVFKPGPAANLDETKILPKVAPDLLEEPATDQPTEPTPAPNKKKRRRWPWITAIIVALLVLTGLGAAYASGNRDIPVPDITGLTVSQAKGVLQARKLELGQSTEKYSDSVAKNHIISSDPSSNTSVKSGSQVDIVLSRGPRMYTLKDYTGLEYADVKQDLTDRNFTVKRSGKTSTKPAGTILDQDIDAGRAVDPKTTTITFTVSTGPRQFKLRDLSGYNQKSVEGYAEEMGLQLNLRQAFSNSVPKDTVISQDPGSGASMTKGDVLTVVMSKGQDGASSSSSSTSEFDKEVTIPYAAPDASTSGSVGNKVVIYLSDSKHSMSSPYKQMTITSDETVTLHFILNPGQAGSYKILRDGQEIAAEDNVTDD